MIAIVLIAMLSTSPGTVLVLKDGGALAVRSYEIDGKMTRIVSVDGKPLILRTSKIDLEASERATGKLRSTAIADVAPKPDRPSGANLAPLTLLQASDDAIERGSRGGFTAVSGPARVRDAARPVESKSLPVVSDSTDWAAKFEALRVEYRRTEDEHAFLLQRYKTMPIAWHDVHGQEHADRSAIVERGNIGADLVFLRSQLKALNEEFDDLKEDARRAGVKPVVYRRGLH